MTKRKSCDRMKDRRTQPEKRGAFPGYVMKDGMKEQGRRCGTNGNHINT